MLEALIGKVPGDPVILGSVTPLAEAVTGFALGYNSSDQMYYAFGGGKTSGVSSTAMFKRRLIDTSWTQITQTSGGLKWGNGVVGMGKLFVPGGLYGTLQTNTMRIFDINTATWSTSPAFPDGVARQRMNICSDDNDYVYVGGGYNSGQAWGTQFARYRVSTGLWEALPAGPWASAGGVLLYWNGKVYHFGGYTTGLVQDLHEFNVATNTWKFLSKSPVGGVWNPGVAVDGKLILPVWGGDKFMVQLYDIGTATWKSIPLIGLGYRVEYRMAVTDTVFLIAGGVPAPVGSANWDNLARLSDSYQVRIADLVSLGN